RCAPEARAHCFRLRDVDERARKRVLRGVLRHHVAAANGVERALNRVAGSERGQRGAVDVGGGVDRPRVVGRDVGDREAGSGDLERADVRELAACFGVKERRAQDDRRAIPEGADARAARRERRREGVGPIQLFGGHRVAVYHSGGSCNVGPWKAARASFPKGKGGLERPHSPWWPKAPRAGSWSFTKSTDGNPRSIGWCCASPTPGTPRWRPISFIAAEPRASSRCSARFGAGARQSPRSRGATRAPGSPPNRAWRR